MMYPCVPFSDPHLTDFAYCQDDATQVIYIHGDGSDLANMDIDCDGLQTPRPDDRCGASADTQSETAFMDTVAQYSGGGSSGSDDNEKRSVSSLNVKRKSGSKGKKSHHNKPEPHSSKTKSNSDPDSTEAPDPGSIPSPVTNSTTESAPSSEPTQIPPGTGGPGISVSDLNANYIPYVVFGNEGSKAGFTTFDPTKFGVQPLSVMAVVCGDQMVSPSDTLLRVSKYLNTL
jgi:hypothetical protein